RGAGIDRLGADVPEELDQLRRAARYGPDADPVAPGRAAARLAVAHRRAGDRVAADRTGHVLRHAVDELGRPRHAQARHRSLRAAAAVDRRDGLRRGHGPMAVARAAAGAAGAARAAAAPAGGARPLVADFLYGAPARIDRADHGSAGPVAVIVSGR